MTTGPWRFEIRGRTRGGPASIVIDDRRLIFRPEGEPAGNPVELDLAAPFTFVVRDESRGGLLVGAGVVLLALAVLWLGGGIGAGLTAGAAAAGAVLLALGIRARRSTVFLEAGDFRVELTCAGRARGAARDAADFVRLRRPESRREASRTLLGFLGREARALFASRARLRNEYLALSGGKPDAASETRYARLRRGLAASNLAWLVVLPVGLAAAVYGLFPTPDRSWAVTRSLLVFLAASFLAVRLLPRIQRARAARGTR